jgi:PBP1b-binding outer membrane lipoprotein LpoB
LKAKVLVVSLVILLLSGCSFTKVEVSPERSEALERQDIPAVELVHLRFCTQSDIESCQDDTEGDTHYENSNR